MFVCVLTHTLTSNIGIRIRGVVEKSKARGSVVTFSKAPHVWKPVFTSSTLRRRNIFIVRMLGNNAGMNICGRRIIFVLQETLSRCKRTYV